METGQCGLTGQLAPFPVHHTVIMYLREHSLAIETAQIQHHNMGDSHALATISKMLHVWRLQHALVSNTYNNTDYVEHEHFFLQKSTGKGNFTIILFILMDILYI